MRAFLAGLTIGFMGAMMLGLWMDPTSWWRDYAIRADVGRYVVDQETKAVTFEFKCQRACCAAEKEEEK